MCAYGCVCCVCCICLYLFCWQSRQLASSEAALYSILPARCIAPSSDRLASCPRATSLLIPPNPGSFARAGWEGRGTGATVAKMVSSSRLEPKWRQTPKDVDMYNIYFWSTTGYSARTERGRATPEGEAWRVGKASLPKPRDLMKGRGCAALIHVTRWPPGAPAPPS